MKVSGGRTTALLSLLACTLAALLYWLPGTDPTADILHAVPSIQNAVPSERASDFAVDRVESDVRARDTAVWLLVVDAADRRPLADARVRIQLPSGSAESTTGTTGRVRLDISAGENVELALACKGYLAVRGRIDLLEGVNTIAMDRAARVVVRAIDSAGAPIAGVRLRLLPPRPAGDEWEAKWQLESDATPLPPREAESPPRATFERGGTAWHLAPSSPLAAVRTDASGEDGMVVWDDVRPGRRYRVGILRPRIGDLTPPHERKRFEVLDTGAVKVQAPPPEGLSGAFDLEAGATRELRCKVLTTGSIRGFIACEKPTILPQIKLCRLRESGGPKPVVTFDAEHVGSAPPPRYEFVIRDLRPGKFLLRTWWKSGTDVFFAMTCVQVTSGSSVDVGALRARQGLSNRVTLRIEDEAGQHVRPASVLVPTKNGIEGIVSITVKPDSLVATDLLSELVVLPIGVQHRLHGLPRGRLFIQGQPTPWTQPRPGRSRPRATQTARTQVEEGASHVLSLVAEGGWKRRVSAVDGEGRAHSLSMLFVRRIGDPANRVRRVALQESTDDPKGSMSLMLASGDYEIFASVPGQGDEGGYHASAIVRFGPRSASVIRLTLEPGMRVRGRVTDAAGEPIADKRLSWVYGVWPYHATTNRRGMFAISGVPKSATLTSSESPRLNVRCDETQRTTRVTLISP